MFSFVGDGISDRCVSLAATRVFARDDLARWLQEQGAEHDGHERVDAADEVGRVRDEQDRPPLTLERLTEVLFIELLRHEIMSAPPAKPQAEPPANSATVTRPAWCRKAI